MKWSCYCSRFASRTVVAITTSLALSMGAVAELPPEKIPNVLTLPASHPDSWIYALDSNFFSLAAGKVVVLDVAADTRQYKGSFGASTFASFIVGKKRPEFYVVETFYPRRDRGERDDVVSVFSKDNLEVVAEISLPGGKRFQSMPLKSHLALVDNEHFLLVENFTPTASVTVVDLDARKVVGEIATSGCALMFATGERGFTSICGDGTLLTTRLDANGALSAQERSSRFVDIDNDPVFGAAARVAETTYFVTFKGMVKPLKLGGDKPEDGVAWPLLSAAEQDSQWRPGGWQIVAAHPRGELYTLMNEHGQDGAHKDGGGEVWVHDVNTRARLRRIPLKNWSFCIEVTNGNQPYLVATNLNFEIDVYDATTGEHIRTIGGRATETPFLLYTAE